MQQVTIAEEGVALEISMSTIGSTSCQRSFHHRSGL